MMERTIERAQETAYRTVLYYQQSNGKDDIESSIVDLIADLLLLSDQYGVEAADLVDTAMMHYRYESEPQTV